MTSPNPSETPLVTVAIPTYNRAERFLPAAISAACGQTYRNLEILVSDNASQDKTTDVVASFRDPRIRYHRHQENIGGSPNINFCIREARGAYIHLLMDDDSIDPDFVECCIAAAHSNPEAGLVRTGTRVIDDAGGLVFESYNRAEGLDFTNFVLAWTEGRTAPYLCSTLFKSAPLQELGMHSRHNLWNDVITELPIAARHGRVDIPDVKATFCMHGGATTVGVDIERWLEDSVEIIETACRLAPNDAELLRGRLRPFLAAFNYQNALRLNKPWPERLKACLRVNNLLGKPPDMLDLARQALRQNHWWNRARKARRTLRAWLRTSR
jgi:glycosyltransferase involved in cell wall biosynthesis